jgi:hypothetical protein
MGSQRFLPPTLPHALALLLFIAACGSPFAEAPPVADSTLVSTLAELHLAEARLQNQQGGDADRAPPRRSSADSLTAPPLPPAVRDSILARHGMTNRQLRVALRYYVRHPEQYAALYGRVVDTLSAEREALRFENERSGEPPDGEPPDGERASPPAFRQNDARD